MDCWRTRSGTNMQTTLDSLGSNLDGLIHLATLLFAHMPYVQAYKFSYCTELQTYFKAHYNDILYIPISDN